MRKIIKKTVEKKTVRKVRKKRTKKRKERVPEPPDPVADKIIPIIVGLLIIGAVFSMVSVYQNFKDKEEYCIENGGEYQGGYICHKIVNESIIEYRVVTYLGETSFKYVADVTPNITEEG